MRTLTKIAIAAVAALALVAALTPAEAACGDNPLIRTRTGPGTSASFIWNPGNFTAGYLTNYPPFDIYYPPWTPNATATFWALGTGDPVGGGNDADTWTFPTYGWMYYNPTYYNYLYGPTYYPGWYAGEIFAGWGANSQIDGCLPPQACTCLLIEDNDGVTGYFAILSDDGDPLTNYTDLIQPGNDGGGNFGGIALAPIPPPTILASARKGGGSLDLDITATIVQTDVSAGIYQSSDAAGCACGPTGYKVMQAIVLRGAPPPTDRWASWAPMNLVGGGTQGFTPIGTPVAVESLCGSADNDVWMTSQLEFDSGFTTSIVSGNATRVECGPNVADPDPIRPRFRPDDIRPPARQPRRSR